MQSLPVNREHILNISEGNRSIEIVSADNIDCNVMFLRLLINDIWASFLYGVSLRL